MKVATWNVNSVRARLPRLLEWLDARRPDVACLQETKVEDGSFPYAELEAAGYRALVHGQKTYNGVAVLSRETPTETLRGLPGEGPEEERRLAAARIGGTWVIDVYAPNGGDLGLPKYEYKLDWYRRLRAFLDERFDAADEVLLCGDMNVAPDDRDVWDPERWRGRILCSDAERRALAEVVAWGFDDALRLHRDEGGIFTWWDYRMGAFHRGWGLRIDHVYTTPPLSSRCVSVEVDRDFRKGPKPSDHAPVIATFAPRGA